MNRGDLYLVRKSGAKDLKRQRVFVTVSRPALMRTNFSTVICAPAYSRYDGLETQVSIGVDEGLKHESSVHCDELVSLPRSVLTHYVGRLGETKLRELNHALLVALELTESWEVP